MLKKKVLQVGETWWFGGVSDHRTSRRLYGQIKPST